MITALECGNHRHLVLRFAPIVLAFALGALASWWIVRPGPGGQPVSAASATSEVAESARVDVVAEIEATIGVPPDTATLPSSHPSAGQKRALARALAELERNPPAPVDAIERDPEAANRFADAFSAALAEGDSR